MPLTQVNNDVLEPATVQSIRDSIFVAGTRIAFQQTTAPTGWTKDTTAAMNDSIMRIVTGSAGNGGSTAFSTFAGVTAVGATTLTTTQIPSHSHIQRQTAGLGSGGLFINGNNAGSTVETSLSTASTGGGGSHNHSVNNNIKYYDFIIASKD